LKKLDKYLLKAFLGPFFAILLIVVFILLLQFLWLYIDELVGKGLGLKVILEFLWWGSATMLPLSMPLAVVLSSMMTMGSMAENSELIALKSAGIPLSRILRPVMLTSATLAVGAFFVSNNLVPTAYNKIYELRENILKTKDEIKIPSKTFYNGIEGYVLRVEENDSRSGMMHNVMVYDHTSGKGNVSLTIADSAVMRMSEDKTFLTFALYNGTNYQEDNSYMGRDTTRQLQRTEFTCQELIIPVDNYKFEKTSTGRYSDQAKCMRLIDLMHDQDSIRVGLDSIRREQLRAFRMDRALMYSGQLDSARRAVLHSVFDLSLVKAPSLDDNINIHNNAINNVSSLIATLSTFDRDTYAPDFTLKLVDIEVYKKFSVALICFLLFFIGAPLGALIRKGGIGMPAIVSVLFFVLYYIIDIIGSKLARDGAVNPFIGTFIACLVLAPIGAFFTYKAINDEPILGTDGLKNRFNKIKRYIMEKIRHTTIVYMGTPEFAVAPLQAILDKGYRVAAVVTVPDKASGRGMNVNQSAVKKFAVEKGIPVLQPENLRDEGFISTLTGFNADLFVVVAFRLLPKEVWSIPKHGCFNLHAALLPQYRGAAPINWAVINGEKRTGVTTFLIDDGVDTGTILMREQVEIHPEDTASTIHDKLMELGARTVVATIEGLLDNDIERRVQKSFIQGSEVLKKAPKLSKELCHIDWNDSVRNIVNLIRGLSDYPAAFTELVGRDVAGAAIVADSIGLKIFLAHAAPEGFIDGPAGTIVSDSTGGECGQAGTIVSDGKTYLGICASDGVVLLDSLQLAGKKRMGVEEFLRGFHNPTDYTTTPGTSRSVIEEV